MEPRSLLSQLRDLVEELNSTNSRNDKVAILQKYPQLKTLLRYVYDPLLKFHVSSDVACAKGRLNSPESWRGTELFDLLDRLAARQISGQAALDSVLTFAKQCGGDADLFWRIIDKDLKCRVDVSSINEALPDTIPTFDVALAHKYDDHSHKVNFDTQDWYASRKLDGCRAICIVRNGSATFFSRTGHEFESLQSLAREIERVAQQLKMPSFVLDGEVCIMRGGLEDFKSIVSQVKRKNHDVVDAHYMVFDILGIGAFERKMSESLFSTRQKLLRHFRGVSKQITVVEQQLVRGEKSFSDLFAKAQRQKWEGLILRRDVPYEGKRTTNMLKVKKFHDAEYTVERIECGPFQVIDVETGLNTTIETMTNVIIRHKGNEVSVGSGFSLAERDLYYKNPKLIIGATITVQYFEETVDSKGAVRLRFPTVKIVHGKGGRST